MKKLISLALTVVILVTITACTQTSENKEVKITDKSGAEYIVPDKIQSIVSTSATNTEILSGLGLSDKIVAVDTYSADIDGLKSDVELLDMQNLDMEKIIDLKPDVVVLNEINYSGVADKYDLLKQSGIEIINIEAADSVQDIIDDITFMSKYTKTEEKGNGLVKDIEDAVNTLKESDFGDKVKVYFEISAAPYLYSFGNSTYLNEIIGLCGAENIYANEAGWLSNSDESVINANPDVIITNVSYEGYSFEEIYSRAGWNVISAVKNKQIYLVDANSTSRASQNIVKGIKEIANAIRPGTFE